MLERGSKTLTGSEIVARAWPAITATIVDLIMSVSMPDCLASASLSVHTRPPTLGLTSPCNIAAREVGNGAITIAKGIGRGMGQFLSGGSFGSANDWELEQDSSAELGKMHS